MSNDGSTTQVVRVTKSPRAAGLAAGEAICEREWRRQDHNYDLEADIEKTLLLHGFSSVQTDFLCGFAIGLIAGESYRLIAAND